MAARFLGRLVYIYQIFALDTLSSAAFVYIRPSGEQKEEGVRYKFCVLHI
jgi:hypothetical protein